MPTFYDRFVECEQRWPQNIAVEIQKHDAVEGHTYTALRRMAESVAQWIIDRGHEPGSRLAILADNHPRWTATYLGVIAAGCTAVPLDTAFHSDQVAKLLQDSGSSVLFSDSKHLAVAQQATNGSHVEVVLTDAKHDQAARPVATLETMFSGEPRHFQPVPRSSEDIATLLYTSGTTADPKGVMLTHANLLGECRAVFGLLQLTPSDAVLGVLPLFHALAQMANLLLPLVCGARVVYLETLNTGELVRALRERSVTAFACVPQFYYLIHERIQSEVAKRGTLARFVFRALMKLTVGFRAIGWNSGKIFFRKIHATFGPRMRFLVTGGSRWDPQIGRDFHALGIDILQAYGLTETTGGAMCTPPKDNVIGSVGKPLPGVEVRVIEAAQDEGPAIGEIVIRGPIVMKGYWDRPAATSEVLPDEWLRTGDLGYFDSHGNLFITGRKKEVIVLSSGKNVYPEEIETHYQKSPYIKEICVLGLTASSDEAFSERLHAVVVPDFEILKQRKVVNTKEVIRFDVEGLSHQLASTKRILSYEIWQDELPRTTTRKLKRFEIEKRVRANREHGESHDSRLSTPASLNKEEQSWLQEPKVQRALKTIRAASKAKIDFVGPRDSLELDLGLDSMQRVELVVALEKELGAKVDESRVSEIYTVRELIEMVRRGGPAERQSLLPGRAGWNSILAQESTDPEVLALVKPRPFAAAFLFLLFRFIQLFSRDRFDLHVTGIDKLPKQGPFIISPNHQSYIDPFVVGSLLPWTLFREMFSVGTSDVFGSGFMRRIAHWMRVIVVDPDANLIPAMRAGAFGLRHGRILFLFPEGERSIDGQPKVFKKGAAILALHMQVPIVPVALDGFHEVWPRGKKFFQRFNPLRVTFGDPIFPEQVADPSEPDYIQLTGELRSRVVQMFGDLRNQRRQNEDVATMAARTH
jgi:long-chain acyl-CoA synthetase